MHVPTLISKKRDGGTLTPGEIEFLVDGLTAGSIPDYQWAAMAMAILFRGMTAEETWTLTRAMRDSGDVLTWDDTAPRQPVVDKHSTGGIGDKTSLVLAPLLACDGLRVPMISGRGLGITGGTLDKLESIPGYRTALSAEEMHAQLDRIGCFICGQTPQFCPADRKLYALRDVTGTVPSIPLITASIMSKKLAEGLDRLVLDVKWGRGAFMPTRDAAEQLAASMIDAAGMGGVAVRTLITPMHEPLGAAAGNALEVRESVAALRGMGPPDLENLVLDLAVAVSTTPRASHQARLRDGSAWRKFQEMVAAQGGDAAALEKIGVSLQVAPVTQDVPADRSGILTTMDAAAIGQAVLELGGGRSSAGDGVDHRTGIDHIVKTGAAVRAGDTVCRIHAASEGSARTAADTVRAGIVIA